MWQDLKNVYHLIQSITAHIVQGFPARKITIIGVTGTDGKTTTSSLIYHILKTAGLKTALISTVSAIIDGKTYDTGFHVTTPGSMQLLAYIKKAKQAGVKYLVLEATSIGLHQNRVFGIPFTIGVLTNITNEHLDYHRTYENYVKAKARLFQTAKTSIINADDRSYSYILPYIKDKKVITYAFDKGADVTPKKFAYKTSLIGKFNQLNVLAAIAAAKELSVKDSVIKTALLTFTAPVGREEIVYDKDFKVIIDFAHTPGSFEAVLPELKKMKKGKPASSAGKLIHVFGCAGQRDTYKRSEMGKISASYSDVIILTAEDPRTEKIEDINAEIEKGISKTKFNKKHLYKIPDRKDAIIKAIEIAKPGDVVVTTGKSHEPSMNYGRGEEPWSEHEAVEEGLKRKFTS
jgi:UDP-N-acetylmuramoyl-L-alanyl-D-glutamate--2,6-diaminopimelate ligase